MDAMRYIWDDDKAAANKRKHGVDFDTAAEVFSDSGRIEEYDKAHSGEEDRWLAIGRTRMGVLFVVFTIRFGNTTRIISARKADRDEQRRYHQANS